ncbi:MAG: hypothetical protein KKB63_13255, partial [Alphaproteobacteria bacterium]|nr:hypothetical protein [Alphaproteobacteria bacterium]
MKQICLNRSGELAATANSRYAAPFADNAVPWASTQRQAKMAAGGDLGYLRIERRNLYVGTLTPLEAGLTETYRILVNGVGSGSWVGGTVEIAEGETGGLAPALDVPVQVGDLVQISRDVLGGTPSTIFPAVSLVFAASV